MKTFFLVLWRIIRWIIYFVLLLTLPFAAVFGFYAIKNKDRNLTVHFDTAIVEKITKKDLGQHIVLAKVKDLEVSETYLVINGELLHPQFGFGKKIGILGGYGHAEGDVVLQIMSNTSPGMVDVEHFDGTYLILGAIVIYIVICVITGLRRKKKKESKNEKLTEKPEEIEPIQMEPQDEPLLGNLIEEEPEEILEETIIAEEPEEVEYQEEVKEKTLDELIQREAYEEFKYVEEAKPTTAPKKDDVEIKWCKYLAENGDKEAQYTLAVYYANGYKDIEKNEKLALFWLEKSANASYDKAIKALIQNK